MNKKQLRDHINLIEMARKIDLPKQQEIDEAPGGFMDKALSSMGGRAAKGRVQWRERYDDLIGSWKEYASETGLDTNKIFAQTNFPAEEFRSFLKTQLGFDDEMIKGIKLRGRNPNIKDVFKGAAIVLAKKEYANTGQAGAQGQVAPAAAAAADAATGNQPAASSSGGGLATETNNLFQNFKGNATKASSLAIQILQNSSTADGADDLQKAGIAYLTARGELGTPIDK